MKDDNMDPVLVAYELGRKWTLSGGKRHPFWRIVQNGIAKKYDAYERSIGMWPSRCTTCAKFHTLWPGDVYDANVEPPPRVSGTKDYRWKCD